MMSAEVKDVTWVSQLYATLLRSAAEWEKHDLGWREVTLAVGSLQHMMFEESTRHAMLSMWCMALTAKAADGDDLRTVVNKIFIDNHQFIWSSDISIKDNSIQIATTTPLIISGNCFSQINSILQETQNRVSVDECLLLLKVIAGSGGIQNIISEGYESVLIQASAPLKPVAITNSAGEQSPIWDEATLQNNQNDDSDGCLVIWSDGKVSSVSYVAKCWRGLGLDCCCHLLKQLTNDTDIINMSTDWGHQLALDSTSEFTMGVLEKVSHLPSSYLITTNLLRAIVHRARAIHKYSVLTHLVSDHPEYFIRKWFLEAVIASVDRDKNLKTVEHIILELHRTIIECNTDPCFRSELEKTLSILMGWHPPNRSGDSSSPSPELLSEVAAYACSVVEVLPISRFRSEPYSKAVLKHILLRSVFRDVDEEEAESLSDQWSTALTDIEFQFFSKEVLEATGRYSTVPSELLVGMVPKDGNVLTGVFRILASLPNQHSAGEKVTTADNSIAGSVLKIWDSSFHPHPLGSWSDLAGPVNLVQTSPHTRFEYCVAWHSLHQSGDTSLVKNKCLTPTFVRRLFYLTTIVNDFKTATLIGPSSYKDSLIETYCKLRSMTLIVATAVDVYQLTEWLKSEHTSANKYDLFTPNQSVVHLKGVVPDPSLTRLAKSKEVELIYSISEKQFNNMTDGQVDTVICDPLPVDEVAMITSWMLRTSSQSQANANPAITASIDKIVSLLSAYYTSSQRTSVPLTLSCISELANRLTVDTAAEDDPTSVLIFELVSRLPSLSIHDRAIVRHSIKATKTEIALKFEEAARDEDPAVENEIQIHIQRESQSRVTSFVKDKFRAGKTKFKNIFGGNNNSDQLSPSK
eukprot:TRINITY_DN5344_c0_g1_i1.p1 TRINITY_DN5344_c0_g1~~TRINITY_DN5344_c0_g1_i1.p1  ORF type:complete len:887 (+),score=171.31 TRINITY_DN5344_c0_g1_i1:78-2663(+)